MLHNNNMKILEILKKQNLKNCAQIYGKLVRD